MVKKNLLVFGGGPLQVSIISNALALGFYTIVIDPNDNAVGKSIASKFFRVDGNDFEKTIQIAKKYNIKGIVSSSTDKTLLMMARVAQELSLSFPSYESVLNTIDKAKFKNILKINGLSCAKGEKYSIDNIPKLDDIEYPVIIKPTSNSGSRGVVLCEDSKSFEKKVNEAFSEAKGEILIEEYIEGDEISVEALVFDRTVKILQITDKVITKPPYNVEISQIQPSKYREEYIELIQDYLQKLVDVLGLDKCAIHPEFKINRKGLFLLEMGPRLGGDFITSHLVPLSTGINMEKALIQIATETKVNINAKETNSSIVKFFNFTEDHIVKKNIDIDYFLSKYPKLVLLESSLNNGEKIMNITNSLNRYGHFILKSNDRFQLESEATQIEADLYNEITTK